MVKRWPRILSVLVVIATVVASILPSPSAWAQVQQGATMTVLQG